MKHLVNLAYWGMQWGVCCVGMSWRWRRRPCWCCLSASSCCIRWSCCGLSMNSMDVMMCGSLSQEPSLEDEVCAYYYFLLFVFHIFLFHFSPVICCQRDFFCLVITNLTNQTISIAWCIVEIRNRALRWHWTVLTELNFIFSLKLHCFFSNCSFVFVFSVVFR